MGATASSGNLANPFPFGNPLAAPFMPVSPEVAGVRDTEWDMTIPNLGTLVSAFTIPAGVQPLAIAAASTVLATPNNGQQMPMDADYDYLCREIQFVIQDADTSLMLPSDLRIRIRDGNGKLFTTDFCYASDLNGPLAIPWALKRGSVLNFDLQNANATQNITSLFITLKGWKRAICPEQEAVSSGYIPLRRRFTTDPTLLSGAELEDYEYPFTFTSAVMAALLKLPLQTDNDADFLWRGLAGDWNNPANDVTTVGNVVLAFYDPNGTPLGSFPFTFAGFPQPVRGMLRECILSNGGGAPNPMYPEIFIPRGGVPQVDVYFADAETVRFSLRGLKVYKAQTGL
jgi:hypothetical protein